MSGGVYMYRATAECSACGKVVDIGPFDSLAESMDAHLDGWLVPAARPPAFVLSDAFGARFTLCDGCMRQSVRKVLDDITKRHAPT